MKKILIGMAAGAMALGASVVPVSAGSPENESIWSQVQDNDDFAGGNTLADLILIAGLVPTLDACGNGKPFFTFFAPQVDEANVEYDFITGERIDIAWADALLAGLGLSLADAQSAPAVVLGLLNDHIVNGFIDQEQITNQSVTRLVARSGFVLTLTNDYDALEAPEEVGGSSYDDINVNGISIDDYDYACNGMIYWIDGIIDSTPQLLTGGTQQAGFPSDGSATSNNPTGDLPDTL